MAAACTADGGGNEWPPPPAGDGENGFLDLGHGVMADLLEIDMRHVRHLVGDDHGVNDGRAVDGKRFAQRRFQLTPGSRAVNPCPPQARANAAKSGFGNSMASRNGTSPTLSASSVISPSAEL